MIIGKQFEPFVIPCKPTSSKVKVELVHESGEVNLIDYEDTIGFNVTSEIVNRFIDVFCDLSLGNATETKFYYLAIARRFFVFFNHLKVLYNLESI